MTARPDIILVMTDEHAPQVSSVYGHPRVRTPAMARLAAEGLAFDAAYCASPICVPSRMAFLSGRMPSRTGAWDNGAPLPSDVPTLAHVMRAAGYETVLIGKMHFIGPDQTHGFETRLVDDSRVCGTWIESNDWDDPSAPRAGARRRVLRAGAGQTAHTDTDEDVLAAALDLLARRAGPDPRRPLFLCIGFNAPHFPLLAPEHFDSYWPDGVDPPRIAPGELEGQHPFHHRLRSYFDVNDLTDEQVLRARAAYSALVTWMDGMLGRIVDAVDAMAPSPDRAPPLTVYTSDHGEMIGEHGLWWKNCFFEEAARVPLILRWPGRIAPGTRTGAPVTLIDLSLTLAEIAGAGAIDAARPFLAQADGRGFGDVLAGAPGTERVALSEYLAHAAALPIRMIRQGQWKYVHYHGEPAELYDLAADPGEKRNLAGRAELATLEAGLRARLLQGWDPDEIDRRVRRSQADRRLVALAEDRGTFE